MLTFDPDSMDSHITGAVPGANTFPKMYLQACLVKYLVLFKLFLVYDKKVRNMNTMEFQGEQQFNKAANKINLTKK